MKKTKHSLQEGKERFDAYFTAQYQERWATLSKALLQKKSYTSIYNTHRGHLSLSTNTHSATIENSSVYHLDTASYIVAAITAEYMYTHTLRSLLDMCTAPGGKLLALYTHFLRIIQNKHHTIAATHNNSTRQQDIFDDTQQVLSITANDKSPLRLAKAKKTIQAFLNEKQIEQCMFTCKNAALFGKHAKRSYEVVLLDTPCSNERHVYQSTNELSRWNKKRCTRMAMQQRTLLCAAIDACVWNGIVVYITCSLSNEENDELIAHIKKKRNIICITHNTIAPSIMHNYQCVIEKTDFGIQILPDTSHGAGPMYMSILQVQK